MSVFEPDTTDRSRDAADLPNFPVVLRGYDRQQVAAYIEELAANLEGERQRANQAERHMAQMQLEISAARNQPPPTFEHLGAQAARVLEQAGESAERLVEEAQIRGEGIIADAQGQAADLVDAAEQQAEQFDREAAQRLAEAGRQRDRMLAAAEHDAEQLRAGADADARRMLAEARTLAERIRREAEDERATIEAETDQLQDVHDSLLRHLNQVHSELGGVLAVKSGASQQEPSPGSAPADEQPAAGLAESQFTADTTQAGPRPAAERAPVTPTRRANAGASSSTG
jgi:cell division septum initiation protein DivIVA